MAGVGTAIGAIGAIGGGLIAANGAQSAADTQANAANRAADIGLQEFQTIQGQENPFMSSGYGAVNWLNQYLGTGPETNSGVYGSLLQPFTADTMKQYSPAYQFQLEQGRQGVLNGDASSMGALSGAAQKDLMNYNQDLAGTAFNNAFNQYQSQNQNIYNRLFGLAQLGQTSAANTGAAGSSLIGQGVMPAIANVGASQAAGQVGMANAWSGALQSATPWIMSGMNKQQVIPADEGGAAV